MSEFTGERVIPGQVNPDLWAEHISRYLFATPYAKGARVLDIGCGTGYGTAQLAGQALRAEGIDIAPDAVGAARERYPFPNLVFTTASATALPFPDASFDLVTGFEVIEHLEDWRGMLTEARRVLAPDGLFLVSTPNRAYYTESRGESGANPFHVHEFEYQEFQQELAKYFPRVTMLLQNRVDAFAFYPVANSPEPEVDAYLEPSADKPESAYFFLGLCSIQSSYEHERFVYVPKAANLLREREHHIRSLQGELSEKLNQYQALETDHTALEKHLAEQNAWGQSLDRELNAARAAVAELQQELESRNVWARSLDDELNLTRTRFAELQAEFEERSAWAQALNHDLEERTRDLGDARAKLGMVAASRWMRLGRKLNLGPQFETSE